MRATSLAALSICVMAGLSPVMAEMGNATQPSAQHAPAVVKFNGPQSGIASVYSGKRNEGGPVTSNGERINPHALTAAHRTLPFGSVVKVTNKRNGRSVFVRINDRGPFKRGRIIDLTPAGAKRLGVDGLAPVTLARF